MSPELLTTFQKLHNQHMDAICMSPMPLLLKEDSPLSALEIAGDPEIVYCDPNSGKWHSFDKMDLFDVFENPDLEPMSHYTREFVEQYMSERLSGHFFELDSDELPLDGGAKWGHHHEGTINCVQVQYIISGTLRYLLVTVSTGEIEEINIPNIMNLTKNMSSSIHNDFFVIAESLDDVDPKDVVEALEGLPTLSELKIISAKGFLNIVADQLM